VIKQVLKNGDRMGVAYHCKIPISVNFLSDGMIWTVQYFLCNG